MKVMTPSFILNQPLASIPAQYYEVANWSRAQWGTSGDFTVSEITHFVANTQRLLAMEL